MDYQHDLKKRVDQIIGARLRPKRHSALLLPALILSAGCGDVSIEDGSDVSQVSDELTYASGVTFHQSGETLDACFLASGFETQKEWIKGAIYRTWEYSTDIKLNWLSTCPSSGSIVRIGIQQSGDSGQGGWAKATGVASLADEQAINDANQQTPTAQKPTFKLWLQTVPSGQGRVEYLAAHEFGHVLGFVDEGSGNSTVCDDIEANGTTPNGVPLTPYDIESLMNYCNSGGNGVAVFTGYDMSGSQSVYGWGQRYLAAVNMLL